MRTTIRLRLTLSQTVVFAVMAALLVTGTYLLTARSIREQEPEPRSRVEQSLGLPPGTLFDRRSVPPLPPPDVDPSHRRTLRQVAAAVQAQTRSELLRNLVVYSGGLVIVATLLTFLLGWLLARRSLRPLRRITARAKTLSARDLNEPIGLHGPHDESRELADTFDEMLGRLDRAFSSQRLFAANASHELRTPLTRIRTKLDVTLAKPVVGRQELDEMAAVIRDAVDRCAALIEALLLLARAEAGLRTTVVNLDEVVSSAARDLEEAIAARHLSLTTSVDPVAAQGDNLLLEHLVRNLLDNAVKHNVEGGWIRVETSSGPMALLRVSNSGPEIAESSVQQLFVPLRRGEADRMHGMNDGFGLGLPIVKAIAEDAGGWVQAEAIAEGGLLVTVALPMTQDAVPALASDSRASG